MSKQPQMDNPSRRRFLVNAAAGGLTVAFHIPFTNYAEAEQKSSEVNAWVVVGEDDTVTIRIARSEMGQGTLTGLAQLVAEELECDWSKVITEYPTPGQNLARQRIWGNFSTGGSRGIRESQDYVRRGGAAARLMLMTAASQAWEVPASELTVSKGVITHQQSGRATTFGKVAFAASKLPVPKDIALKDLKDWKVIGKRLARLDTVDKVNGKQRFGVDIKLPGMLNAAIKDCPVFGGKVLRFDDAAIKERKGVRKVVTVGESAVAVIADTWWQAKTALDAMSIEWDFGAHASASSAAFEKTLDNALFAQDAIIGNKQGDALGRIAASAKQLEAVYSYPHQHHATMEPMNAIARYTPERCEVWTPTQNGEAALAAVAEASGLPASRCEVYKMHLGGGFGRRGAIHDWVRQAVKIAQQLPGIPVKLLWSREEDMLHGRFHPITKCRLTAGLDEKGNLTALHMRIAGQSILAGVAPQNIRDGRDPVVFQGLNAGGGEAMIGYSFPHLLIDHAMRNPHVPPGFWRGVNLNQNAIYLECFIDEVAAATKKDPLSLRLALMDRHPQHRAVLQAVADHVRWAQEIPDVNGMKVFRGLAQTHGFGSYVAACAEISITEGGNLVIHRIVAAIDCGHAVNPQQIEAQIEGSFAFGLSAALLGQCTVKNGQMEQSNFHTYPVLKIHQMPKVESIIMPSGGFWGGVGEPTIAVAAPAVLNAIFAATGIRIRRLPIAGQSLKRI